MMKPVSWESRHLSFTALLLSLIFHLLPLSILVLTISAKPIPRNPLMTFLGPILRPQDFILADKLSQPQSITRTTDISLPLISNSKDVKSFFTFTKPQETEKIRIKQKETLKPPKQFYISDDILSDNTTQEDLKMKLPPSTPLKLNTP